jgi:uncharacterized protein (TIGR02996 family)
MAKLEAPQTHVIELAPTGRSKCQTCQRAIANGELRLSEAWVAHEGPWARSHAHARTPRPRDFSDDDDRRSDAFAVNPDLAARFHHLACAAKRHPYMLRSALAATTLEIPGRDDLERAIEQGLSVADVAEEAAATREEYQRFMARLHAGDDDALQVVFADWLQQLGDPRGELMAVQRELGLAEGDARARLATLEKKLLAAHRDRLVPDRLEGGLVWRAGFVHRLELTTVTSLDRVTLARAFRHPSLRLLRELAVPLDRQVVAANLPSPLPATLRVLELGREPEYRLDTDGGLGDVAELVCALPALERLVLGASCDLALRSPVLRELELRCLDAREDRPAGVASGERRTLLERLPLLEASELPKLRVLNLHVNHGLESALETVLSSSLAPQLRTLGLRGDLSSSSLAQVSRFSALEVLDLRGCSLSAADFERISRLVPSVLRDDRTASVKSKPRVSTEWRVRHTRRPEWGIGTVVAESDAGLEIEFPQVGRKEVRNVELLEDVSE